MKKYNWYRDINLIYKHDKDIDFDKEDIKFIKNMLIRDNVIRENLEVVDDYTAIQSLIRKGVLTYNPSEKGCKYSFTEYGAENYKTLIDRLKKFPTRDGVRKFLKREWYGKGNTRKELEKLTGIRYHTLTHIDTGNSFKPVNLKDIRKIFEQFSDDWIEAFVNIRKSEEKELHEEAMKKWLSRIELEYARKSDPLLTEREIIFLLDIYKGRVNRYTAYSKVGEYLKEIGFLAIDEEDDKIRVNLTEKGKVFLEDILERKRYPKLDTLVRILIRERKKSGWSTYFLSEKSGVSEELILKLEERSQQSFFDHFNESRFVYIEDIIALFESLHLEFESILKEELMKNETVESHQIKEGKRKSETLENKVVDKRHSVKEISSPTDPSVVYKLLISESPIETKLLKELINYTNEHSFYLDTQKDFSINGRGYRVDIYIEFTDSNNKKHKIVVECDGHEYHEKTKEQAQRDKQRDRDFLSQGILTLRFTGSEIWKNPKKCVEEIFSAYSGFQEAISL